MKTAGHAVWPVASDRGAEREMKVARCTGGGNVCCVQVAVLQLLDACHVLPSTQAIAHHSMPGYEHLALKSI